MPRPRAGSLLLAFPLVLSGCLERTVTITSDPPGAVVWMNDVQVGRTPVTTGFTFYGDYDVRVRREGNEPVVTAQKLRAPIYEYPPVDLAALALPVKIRTRRAWHFDLQPQDPVQGQAEADLIVRARDMQAQATAP